MATIPYALSIQHFVNSVGAKAGFASIIGLALLVLIFFTQSRETANLRRRADEAEQQLYQLQLHVDHLSRTRGQQAAAPAAAQTTDAPVAAPPAAAAAAVAARAAASRTVPGEQSAGGGVATIPAAPAGVGAPALSSATRLIPLAEPDEISIRALKPSANGGSGGEGTANGAIVTPAPAPAPPPSTAAGGAAGAGNGVTRPPVPVPMPTMAASAARATPPPRQGRSPVSPPPQRRSGRERTGRRFSPVIFVLAGILGVAAVAVALVLFTGSSNNGAPSNGSPAAASASGATAGTTGKASRRRRRPVTVTPSAVTVAVLNGTTTNNLAHDVLAKLTSAGYHGGTNPQDASETALTSTIVGYTTPADRADALAVAKSLNLGPASVQQVSQGDRSKVCGSATSCPAQVVVTAGADLAPNG